MEKDNLLEALEKLPKEDRIKPYVSFESLETNNEDKTTVKEFIEIIKESKQEEFTDLKSFFK